MLAKSKKKGKAPKKSGFAWAANFENKPAENATVRELAELVVSQYRTRTGKTLHRKIDQSSDIPKALWSAPIAVLAVSKVADGSVVCTYANQAACEALGHPAADGYKSVMDAPSDLAASSGDSKFESGYSKKLGGIALEDAQRWTLDKMAIVDGKLASSTVGVAYCFETWIDVADGFICSPGGVRTPPALDAAEVEAAVTAQGALVRKLKEEDGLANGDPAVKAAVAELLRLKAVLEEL